MIRMIAFALSAAILTAPAQSSMIERWLSPAVSTLGTGAVRVCVDTTRASDDADTSGYRRNVLTDLKAVPKSNGK